MILFILETYESITYSIKLSHFVEDIVNKFELDVISGGGGYGTFIFTTNFVALVTPEVVTSSSVYILNSISNRLAQL